MKALVLAGGVPQAILIKKLKRRNIATILADYLPNPVARPFADKFYQKSTLDIDTIREIAIREQVDFLITVCTDQALLTVAILSEELNLPCYISAETARNVTNKRYMKTILKENDIPTANFEIIDHKNYHLPTSLNYPLIVKPVDCNSSKGVQKASDDEELSRFICDSANVSRSHCVIVEEFKRGRELSVDVYIADGNIHILSIIEIKKIREASGFVIHRTLYPASVSSMLRKRIIETAKKIAVSFSLHNSPLLIQLIASNDDDISVIEFSARTGGGMKFSHIKAVSGFDVIEAVIDLTLGNNPQIELSSYNKFRITEYLYCHSGTYNHYSGVDSLVKNGVIDDFYIYKSAGDHVGGTLCSGDRIAAFTVSGNNYLEASQKHQMVSGSIHICDSSGRDLLHHDLLHLDT